MTRINRTKRIRKKKSKKTRQQDHKKTRNKGSEIDTEETASFYAQAGAPVRPHGTPENRVTNEIDIGRSGSGSTKAKIEIAAGAPDILAIRVRGEQGRTALKRFQKKYGIIPKTVTIRANKSVTYSSRRPLIGYRTDGLLCARISKPTDEAALSLPPADLTLISPSVAFSSGGLSAKPTSPPPPEGWLDLISSHAKTSIEMTGSGAVGKAKPRKSVPTLESVTFIFAIFPWRVSWFPRGPHHATGTRSSG